MSLHKKISFRTKNENTFKKKFESRTKRNVDSYEALEKELEGVNAQYNYNTEYMGENQDAVAELSEATDELGTTTARDIGKDARSQSCKPRTQPQRSSRNKRTVRENKRNPQTIPSSLK